jgi:hypothetical protein
MKIKRVGISIREVSLYTETSSSDFKDLSEKDQLKELKVSSPQKALSLFKTLKAPTDKQIQIVLKKNPKVLKHIKPLPKYVEYVLDEDPSALNLIPKSKVTDDLLIKAIRPTKKVLAGPKDIVARETLKNVSKIDKGIKFSPRAIKEIKKLIKGISNSEVKRANSLLSKRGITEIEMSASSIVRSKYPPYTLTVAFPGNEDTRYEYYIGSWPLFNKALSLQNNPGEFSAFVKQHELDCKKFTVGVS